jgi:quercetin dioxygenase-like cupin family protein
MEPSIGFVGVADATACPFEEPRHGCGKRVVSENEAAQASMYRLLPGCRVPAHRHTRSDDLFIGVSGEVLVRAEGSGAAEAFVLRAGGCCRVSRGVRHEVLNPSATQVAFFVLVHAPYAGFDNALVPGEGIEPS